MVNVWEIKHRHTIPLPLEEALSLQENLFQRKLSHALSNDKDEASFMILAEHESVYTCNQQDLKKLPQLVKKAPLPAKLVALSTQRGGSITYHGPGQLVCYLIVNLKKFGIAPGQLASLLDETIINTISGFGLRSRPKPQNMPIAASGVWIETPSGIFLKIASRGLRVSHGITRFGFALNVNTDLSYFDAIYPCGLDIRMTSMAQCIGRPITMPDVAYMIQKTLTAKFGELYQK